MNYKNYGRAITISTSIPILLVTFAFSAFASPPELPTITEFKIEVQYNAGKITEDIIADIYGDSLIVGIIPYQQAELNLAATFATTAGMVTVNGIEQESTITLNDFSDSVSYVVTSGEDTRTYKVKLVYTGLPVVYVYTHDAAPILNKDDYVAGTIKIYPNGEGEPVFSSAMGIRGRGNTTWTYPKKPYRIKLGSAGSILGMPADKDWVLLANYADKSLMRNSLAFGLGEQMNFAYTPRTTHVDLVLNGVYQGNYLIGEHVKVDKDRVNIEEIDEDATAEEEINGGYFLELDDYRDGVFFELGSGLPFVVKSPDDVPEVQLEFIKNYMQQTEDAIFSEQFADPDLGYAKYINPETFIEWYWISELVKNIDAKDVSSIFYYKDLNEKLNMGPLWDLDVASGNASILGGDSPTGFYVRESKWFSRLFEDPAFKAAADARWITFRDELLVNLPGIIDDYADKLAVSQQLNFYKWDILHQPIYPSTLVLDTYENEVAYLKEFLMSRIEWIDSQVDPNHNIIGIPQLHSPSDDATVDNLSPTLKWFAANIADEYAIQVSSAENFETLIVNETVVGDTTYSIAPALNEQTTYYWRARSVNADGQSEWSETWSFTTPLISGVGDGTYNISMFPNPTSADLYIEVPSSTPIESAELVDGLGRTAANSPLQAGAATKIDVGHLRRGMYIVILRGRIEKPVMKKIVLK